MHSKIMFALFAAAGLGGCLLPDASRPKTGAAATGEPLSVVDDVKTWTTTYKEKVGESVVKDANGNTIGTVDNYQNRTQTHSVKVWYGFQGGQQLADEDYFRIAGDVQAVDATEKARQAAIKRNHDGKMVMLGGGIGLAVGIGVALLGNSTSNGTLTTVGELVDVVGLCALSGGWYLAHSGAAMMTPEYHAVDRSQAERDAIQYNQRAGTVGLSVGRKF